MRRYPLACLLLLGIAPGLGTDSAHADEPASLAALGRALFFDTSLSEPPGQACATCHDPEQAFSDSRRDGAGGALSVGADHRSLGDRNTPTLTYVARVPPFQVVDGHYVGGFFLDGRAPTLEAQAIEPLTNPLEMALPNSDAVVQRVLARPDYSQALSSLFGSDALTQPSRTLDALTAAIAAFERTTEFSAYDSRFDRYLRGEYVMTRDEAIGRELFFSDLTNCGQCHLNEAGRLSTRETFTNHRYHNIGVPTNATARQANGLGTTHIDLGLGSHPEVGGPTENGKFRVPTLRNVAVTAPYMHNGVFQTLEAAVAFYGKYLLRSRPAQTNPETGRPWREPEVEANLELDILRDGQPLDEARVKQLVAFLRTLTDERFEHRLRR